MGHGALGTWLEALQALVLLALSVQVWRLTREVRRLGRPGSARPASSGRSAPGAPPAGSFATLVTGYLELLSRRPGAADGPASADGTSMARGGPADNGRRPAAGAGGEHTPPTARGGARDGLHPEMARVVELLRQGLGPDEIARQLGMARGEVQVLERLARARGML